MISQLTQAKLLDMSATTTTSLSAQTTTVSRQGSETDYDFEGAIFFKDYERSYYVDDELDLDALTFEVWVVDPNGLFLSYPQ